MLVSLLKLLRRSKVKTKYKLHTDYTCCDSCVSVYLNKFLNTYIVDDKVELIAKTLYFCTHCKLLYDKRVRKFDPDLGEYTDYYYKLKSDPFNNSYYVEVDCEGEERCSK